ncbi:MAG: hypothetical protein Q8O33_04145 [Pseudomonadota bacterium]|nr:hypothetical protein [Pseudomonadota bacterium]
MPYPARVPAPRSDEQIGNALADYPAGNAGKGIFRFADLLDANENLGTILDFNSVDDTIQLERVSPTGLAAGYFVMICS